MLRSFGSAASGDLAIDALFSVVKLYQPMA